MSISLYVHNPELLAKIPGQHGSVLISATISWNKILILSNNETFDIFLSKQQLMVYARQTNSTLLCHVLLEQPPFWETTPLWCLLTFSQHQVAPFTRLPTQSFFMKFDIKSHDTHYSKSEYSSQSMELTFWNERDNKCITTSVLKVMVLKNTALELNKI